MSAFGGGLFGSSNTQNQTSQPAQQPGQSGGLFGGLSSASNTNPGTGPSLFGNPQNTSGNTGGGGMFGNTNTNTAGGSGAGGGSFGSTTGSSGQQPASGGLFGSSTTSTQPTSGGLFGNTTQQPATGGLFGNTNTNTTNQPATGGLFGSTTQTGQQQPASGGLFGSSTTQPSAGGGLFGNPNTSTTGGGLFGNANSTGNTGGGLFGSNANASTSGTTGGSFGNTNPSINTGGGLFGSSTQPSTTSTSNQPSLFGQTQPQQPQQPQSSLFGSTTQSQPQSGLLGGSLFGGQKTAAVPAQQQADAQAQFAQISQRIEAVVAAWNPNSPNNRFQHYFYNLVDPSQVGLYGRPQNATNEALWQRAVRENPDPSCMVPVLATSFDDLQKRVDAQGQQASAHQEKLTEIRSRIEKLGDMHNLKNVARLRQASVVQAQLTHRLLSMVQHLHLLIPALRSSSIRPEEESLRVALEEIESEIRRPGGMGRLVGKLNELWALVGALNAMKSANAVGRTEWTVVDEDGLNQLVQILSEQQAGLAHVTKILQKGLRDTAVIYGEEPKAEETNGRSDLLQSFSQTMRASTIR